MNKDKAKINKCLLLKGFISYQKHTNTDVIKIPCFHDKQNDIVIKDTHTMMKAELGIRVL